MHFSVHNQFKSFNTRFEGVVNYMYLDRKGLVTVGIGNLIDPIQLALELPFVDKKSVSGRIAGTRATVDDIKAEWSLLKTMPALAACKWTACSPLTKLMLSDNAIDVLVDKRLSQNERILKSTKAFRDFDEWPADAQMALLSMAWAMGAAFSPGWPNFCAACATQDFEAASQSCHINDTNDLSMARRNRANKHLLKNAAALNADEDASDVQRKHLYFPQVLLKPVTIIG